ncbi:MAG: IS21-like element helper ATPase IstB [Bacteroidales bacterium]|jgi:DNA replication protein DnaC|nr:IS21-like element helper ATPase IstB [Bacteroidales bacterium]
MEEIKSQLLSLRLTGMSRLWQTLEETRRTGELSLADGMALLLQAEADKRQENRYRRLMKNAGFRYKAFVEEIKADPVRGIDKMLLTRLATGDYIKNGEAIIITGATGCGKSFLASALGHHACKQGYTVGYHNMQKLFVRLKLARADGSIIKLFDRLAKTDLLIIDDFGLTALQGQQQTDFLEIIEDRHAKHSTVIISQLPVANWFDVIGDPVIADAILDRLVHTAHRFELKGESLRKKV